mmetsp:Transcript_32974/g.60369  ORF Transcript_32974/g.60369 Transcript_32974/m.60369 type:complete len:141 (-) Transcript_32974:61-483(-)
MEQPWRRKEGVDLFREILRLMPDAQPQDYIRSGVWQNETMKMDMEILECHRAEAGAPAPRPLEEVPMPKVPPGVLKPVPLVKAIPTPLSTPWQPGGIRALTANFPKSAATPGLQAAAAAPPGVVAKATGMPIITTVVTAD